MRFPQKLSDTLTGQIDFTSFAVLAVVPHKSYRSIAFLTPKPAAPLSYFNMMTGEESVWFTTAGAMLEDAQRRSFIGPLQKAVYLHRYKRLCRRRAK